MFEKTRLLDLIRDFVTYDEDDKGRMSKIVAVKAAVAETIRASEADVVWHTQGSVSMLFYTGCIARNIEMENPTVVVLTDRNDLDDQLWGQFDRSVTF